MIPRVPATRSAAVDRLALGLALIAVFLAGSDLLPHMARVRTVLAQGGCSVYRTWATGDSLTAGDLNSSFTTAVQTNMRFSCLDDLSASTTDMQTRTDPYPSAAESLATTGEGEILRLRYVLRHIHNWPQWYQHNFWEMGFGYRHVVTHRSLRLSDGHNWLGFHAGQLWRNAEVALTGNPRWLELAAVMLHTSAPPEQVNLQGFPVLCFDPSLDETVHFSFSIPSDMDVSRTSTLHVTSTARGAATGTVVLAGGLYHVSTLNQGNINLTDPSLRQHFQLTLTPSPTAGVVREHRLIAFPGHAFTLWHIVGATLYRDADVSAAGGSDDHSQDWCLVHLRFGYFNEN